MTPVQPDRPRAVPRPLTIEEAAALVGCSARTIARLTASGALPAIKAGGRTRIRQADLVAHFFEPTPTARADEVGS